MDIQKRTVLRVEYYSKPEPGWYVVNFREKDLRIGPYETSKLAEKDLKYLQAGNDAGSKTMQLCTVCGKPAEPLSDYCAACEYRREQAAEYREQDRAEKDGH